MLRQYCGVRDPHFALDHTGDDGIAVAAWTGKFRTKAEPAPACYFIGPLLIFTFRRDVFPGGRLMRSEATLPDSTQTIPRYSSLPKSCICWARDSHGFQTTVDAEFSFSMRMMR